VQKIYRFHGLNPAFTFHGEYTVETDSDGFYYVNDDAGKAWVMNEQEFAEFAGKPKGKEEMKVAPQAAVAPFTKQDLLDAAKLAIADRGLNYGRPEDNFARIAAHWNAFLFNRGIVASGGGLISPGDVAIMCALLKIARLENDPGHHDSWVDLAGYAACGAEIELSK
jgi:hypothetical protein